MGIKLDVGLSGRRIRIDKPRCVLLLAVAMFAVGCSQTKPSQDAPSTGATHSETSSIKETDNRATGDLSSESVMKPIIPMVDENTSSARSAPQPTPGPANKETQPSASERKPTPEGNRVEFAPGILIDWSIPRIEIEAQVALHEGPIELLLCSRGTKEHESILVTDASPRRIFEAMGLIGMTPGSPARYNDQTGKTTAPHGDRVAIEIEHNGQTIPAHDWMVSADKSEPVGAISWVFAGSTQIQQEFGADIDGTIICVVDFDTALIAPAESHSADNTELWLAVSDKRVPQKGTPCRVHLRPISEDSAMELTVTPEGQFHWNQKLLSPVELDEIIRRRVEQDPDQKVRLTAVPGTDHRLARVAARCIVGSGIKQEQLTLELPDDDSSAP